MIIEVNYLTLALLAGIVSAFVAGVWGIGRTFLAQYGAMLTDQLETHRSNEVSATASATRRFDALEDELGARMKEHGDRLARLEGVVSKVPTHDEITRLYEKQNDTARSLAMLLGEIKGHGDTLRLILSQIAQKGMQ